MKPPTERHKADTAQTVVPKNQGTVNTQEKYWVLFTSVVARLCKNNQAFWHFTDDDEKKKKSIRGPSVGVTVSAPS